MRLSKRELPIIKHLYLDLKVSISDLAKIYKKTYNAMYGYLVKNNLYKPNAEKIQERMRKVIDLYNERMKVSEIMKITGYSKANVYNILNKYRSGKFKL